MTEDRNTYQRALGASLIGLVVQIVICLCLGVLSLWTASEAFLITFFYSLAGLPIWIALIIVHQQHKLERIESLESEQLAKQGTGSSMFENTLEDLAVARKRLAMLYKWFLPIVALLIASYLVIMGFVLANRYSGDISTLNLPRTPYPTLAIIVGISLACFLVSRYLAGMAKVEAWKLLRSGAAFFMGIVVSLGLLMIGIIGHAFENDNLYRYLTLVLPVFMIVIGIEIVLNFILDLYRPRKRDEMPRPAFDSRLLAFLTSPDSIAKSINEAINYQFGFEITKSWFWQLLSQEFPKLILFGVAVLLIVSSVVIVRPGEEALITRSGALVGEPVGQGLEFKLPWPISRSEIYDVEAVRVIVVGKSVAGLELAKIATDPMEEGGGPTDESIVLWDNQHADDELNMIVAAPDDAVTPTKEEEEIEGLDDTDANAIAQSAPVSVINTEISVQYRIRDGGLLEYVIANADASEVEDRFNEQRTMRAAWTPAQINANKYKYSPNEHPVLVNNVVNSVVSRELLRHTIDEWIGSANVEAAERIRSEIQREAEALSLGIEIKSVSFMGVHPPSKVADSFHEVITARQQMQTTIEDAQRQRIQILTEVAGSVDRAEHLYQLTQDQNALRGSEGDDATSIRTELRRQINRALDAAGGQVSVQLSQARATRWERENEEFGKLRAFNNTRSAFEAAPRLYRARQFLKTVTEGYANARKFLILADEKSITIRGDWKESAGGGLNVLETGN